MSNPVQVNPRVNINLASLANWSAGQKGTLPQNALLAGSHSENQPLYIVRANYAKGVHIGKIGRNWQSALIPYGGREIAVSEYEVFTGKGLWVNVSNGTLPANAIEGGREADGKKLYIARSRMPNGLHIGKTRADWNFAAIPYGGKEVLMPQYEVLISGFLPDQTGTANKDGVTTIVSRNASTASENRGAVSEETNNETGRICTSQQVELTVSNLERIVAKGISDQIYPGAFFQLNSVADGSFQNYNVARAPMEIAVDLVSRTSGSLRSTIGRTNPATINYGTVNDAIIQLLQNNANVRTAAELFSSIEIIKSEEQLRVGAQLDFSGWGAEVSASFGYNKQAKKEFVLLKLTQVYFTALVNTTDPKTLLADPNLIIEGDPVYVSRVKYGRIGYLRVESNEYAETIEAALRFKYTGTANAEGRVSFERLMRSSGLKIDALFLGGGAEQATEVVKSVDVNEKIDKFLEYMRAGAIFDSSVAIKPISYSLKFLKDNRIAHTSMITSFAEQNCRIAKFLKVELSGVSVDNHPEGVWGYVDLEVWELDAEGNLVKQVFPKREGNVTRIWQCTPSNRVSSKPYPMQNGQEDEIGNIRTVWDFWVDRRKLSTNQILLVVKCRLEAEHRDEFAIESGWHGMSEEKQRKIPLQDALNSGKFLRIGPYDSNTNRWHAYCAQFKLSEGN